MDGFTKLRKKVLKSGVRISKIFFILLIAFINLNAQSKYPKNIIILIGDGMGINQISTTLLSNPDSPFYQFKSIGLSITCSADKLITDSAAGSTAIATGYLTKNKYLGVDSTGHSLQSIFEIAERSGLSTGLVVTSTITHATPAGFFANIPDRYDEIDIAEQMVNKDIDVIIGGGAKFFLPIDLHGERKDNQNLISEFQKNGYKSFSNIDQLEKENNSADHLLALIEREALPSAINRDYNLGQLTKIATDHLKQNKKGFVLMIEGSQIDWAAHDHKSNELLAEVKDFETAVANALSFAKKDGNTLVLITADHETGGLAITKGSRDGKDLNLNFSTNGHTPSPVGIFAYGPGEERFRGILKINEIGQNLIKLIKPSQNF